MSIVPGAAWTVHHDEVTCTFSVLDGHGQPVAAYGYTHLSASYSHAWKQADSLARAVNAYGPLVAALERLTACASEGPTLCTDCRDFGLAALARARGEGL